MAEIKLVIFDKDGLIFDTERLYLNCSDYISNLYGYNVPSDLIRRSMGRTGTAIKKMIVEELGDDFPLEEYWKRVHDYEEEYRNNHDPVFKKGFKELLKYLKDNNIKTAIATSTKRQKAISYITRAGILDSLDYIICGDDITESKPSPQIYLKVVDYFNIPKENTLIFEDSCNGLLSAYNAGINCILVPDIAIVPEQEKPKAYKVIESLDLAIDIIKELNNETTSSI